MAEALWGGCKGLAVPPVRREYWFLAGLYEAADAREGLRDGLLELPASLYQSFAAEQPCLSAAYHRPGDLFISASIRSSQAILKSSSALDQVRIVSLALLTASWDRQHSRPARSEL